MQEHIEVDQTSLRRLTSALRQESDGKALQHDLVVRLHAVAEPALAAVRAAILSMGSRSEAEPGLRTTVAARTTIEVHLAGKHAGVAIVAHRSGMPRGFRNAPKRLNARKGWRHPVFATGKWVHQVGKPGWFDDTLKAFEAPAKHEAGQALDDVARRVDYKTRG